MIRFTFTGVDDHTNFDDLAAISQAFPHQVEFACLVGREWGTGRFPSPRTLFEFIGSRQFTTAVHLCGPVARAALETEWHGFNIGLADRVQVNAASYTQGQLEKMRRLHRAVIVQWRTEFPLRSPVHLLFDCSGGKGLSPKAWPAHPKERYYDYGFAGGISPGNVVETLEQIGHGNYWLDMESSLRVNDRFDVSLVWKVLEAAKTVEFVREVKS